MQKDFDNWSQLQKKLDIAHKTHTFREWKIWWCSIGINVGHEENGKNKDCSRPILIIRKFNNHIFWGLPLKTQIKEKCYYHKMMFREKEQCVMLSQMRLLESRRLIDKMGKLSQQQFEIIRSVLRDML